MNMTLPKTFVANRSEELEGRADPVLVELFAGLLSTARSSLARRRWRRARPFVHLNDHLRRDLGLPPLDARQTRHCR